MPVFKVQEHLLPASYIREYPRSLANEHDDDLRIVVKQYTPLDNLAPREGDITIIGAHANGFPKELYEPLWLEIHQRLRNLGHGIRNIFITDIASQGQSGVLNASKLGDDPSWMDVSRDLFLMVNHFRTEIKHPIFGIGHSMGGAHLANLSHLHPRLFTSLILIDPVMARPGSPNGAFIPAASSSVRRDRWPNRAAAEASFKKSAFYQSWDPKVLDLWFKYGLREVPKQIGTANNATLDTSIEGQLEDPEVVLTTTKHQEVFTFIRPAPAALKSSSHSSNLPLHLTHPDLGPDEDPDLLFYRSEVFTTFNNLATLRPSVLYVFASESALSSPPMNDDKLAVTGTAVGGSGGVKAGRVKGVVIEKAGHLVPFEQILPVAENCVAWIVPELARWSEETALLQRDRDRTPLDERAVISKDIAKILEEYVPQRAKQKPEQSKSSKL